LPRFLPKIMISITQTQKPACLKNTRLVSLIIWMSCVAAMKITKNVKTRENFFFLYENAPFGKNIFNKDFFYENVLWLQITSLSLIGKAMIVITYLVAIDNWNNLFLKIRLQNVWPQLKQDWPSLVHTWIGLFKH
jgi:hypothetical protein